MLRDRQLEVCRLRAAGLSAKEVAEKLKISRRVVENESLLAYKTLGVHNVMQMAIALSKFSERAEAATA